MLAGTVSGAGAATGPSTVGGATTGDNVGGATTGDSVGGATGVAAGEEGGLAGDCAGGVTLGGGVASGGDTGETAGGDFTGAATGETVGGAVAGGRDTGETVGDFTGAATGETFGGDETGACEGDTWGLSEGLFAGDLAGAGGDFVTAVPGDGAGALSACTLPESNKKKTRKQNTSSLNMLNCLNLKWVLLRFVIYGVCLEIEEKKEIYNEKQNVVNCETDKCDRWICSLV